MSADPRFDVLFEPVKLGPVTVPNRFYQVPHCTGMGYGLPATLAAMREVKAEGGWGVVNTEYCSIHPSSDDFPAPFASLWDNDDVLNMARMAEGVHRHGALAGVELWHGGMRTANLQTRATALSPESLPIQVAPWQCQKMDLQDIRDYRSWHRAAALRAREAEFDIVYVYAAHTYLIAQFLDPAGNGRGGEYGGALKNRWRLLGEVLEDTRHAIGKSCAIAIRVEVTDEDGGGKEERSEMLAALAPLVDLFDVTIPDYSYEMGSSQFIKEASLESEVCHVRALTGKPVVSVGRFTSPETMLSQVKRGVLDFIGAARPSIADPFLPNKIKEGRFDDVRECIGCNVCYAHNTLGVPLRCTQNPTMGEEWRRGWHPERVRLARNAELVLIAGAGPAGLEAAVTLGKRGVPVMLAERSGILGGRVLREAKLPGLSEWIRVRDWREQQLRKLSNVEVFRGSSMTAADIRETSAKHVLIATGSSWRRDGRGRSFPAGVPSFVDTRTLTPDEIIDGRRPKGATVIFDDDGYYLGPVLALLLAEEGIEVTIVTPAGMPGEWAAYTVEQARMVTRLMELEVTIITKHLVSGLNPGSAMLRCVYTGRIREISCDSFVTVTSREPEDGLFRELAGDGLETLARIGDCRAPGIIAQAVYDGHRAAQEFGETAEAIQVRRERVILG